MKKILKSNIFGFIIGGIIFGGIGVTAYVAQSNEISYTPTDSSFNVKNVKEALDELYNNVEVGKHDVLRIKAISSEVNYSRTNTIYCYFNDEEPVASDGPTFLYNNNPGNSTATSTFDRNNDTIEITSYISAFNTTNYIRTMTLTLKINGEIVKTISVQNVYNSTVNWVLETTVDLSKF